MTSIEEKIETVKSRFATGNLIAIIWILLGTIACWTINPWIGWFFLAFSTFSVYIIIRRLLCNSCYYCKSCTKGLAKLSILFLGAKKIPGIKNSTNNGMLILIYATLTLFPTALVLYTLTPSFDVLKIISLISLLGISIIALVVKLINRNKTLWKR